MAQPTHDLLLSATEINHHHGAGILLHRFFADSSNIVTIRSLSVYQGKETFGIGHHELKSANLTVPETEERLRSILAPYRIGRILCVPYYREDFIHALLAKKLTGAPLCTYLMDDQNVFSPQVPDHWVEQLLQASDLRFGISPELCAAYQHKYRCGFHLLPPLIERPEPLIPCYWQPDPAAPRKVAMIGNVWTADRFRQLRALLRAADVQVDWYGNGSAASWLPGTPEEWEADNIHCLGHLPEEDLVAALAAYPCVLVPSGSLDAQDDNLAFSRLSLPSRLIFLHTRTDTPVLLLGSKDTAAGRFLLNLGTGLCAAYDAPDLLHQLTRIQTPAVHDRLRRSIRQWSPHFVLPEGGPWLWASLEAGRPRPANFQAAFSHQANNDWLQSVSPAKARPQRIIPAADGPVSDEAMKSFAFLRSSHLPLLATAAHPAPPAHEIETTQFMGRMLAVLLQKLLPRGGSFLLLGGEPPDCLKNLPGEFTGWRLRDIEEWQARQFPDDPEDFVDLPGEKYFEGETLAFDAIISSAWLDQIKTPEALGRLAGFLDAHTRPGGCNVHALTAVLHPDYFWTAPAHEFLRRHWGQADWPNLDELLTTPDLFIMGEETYSKYWQPSTGKTYQDFGKALGLFLFWRKPRPASIPQPLPCVEECRTTTSQPARSHRI